MFFHSRLLKSPQHTSSFISFFSCKYTKLFLNAWIYGFHVYLYFLIDVSPLTSGGNHCHIVTVCRRDLVKTKAHMVSFQFFFNLHALFFFSRLTAASLRMWQLLRPKKNEHKHAAWKHIFQTDQNMVLLYNIEWFTYYKGYIKVLSSNQWLYAQQQNLCTLLANGVSNQKSLLLSFIITLVSPLMHGTKIQGVFKLTTRVT